MAIQLGCNHCACAISYDLFIGEQFGPSFLKFLTPFVYSLCNLYGATANTGRATETMNGPALKARQKLIAHALVT